MQENCTTKINQKQQKLSELTNQNETLRGDYTTQQQMEQISQEIYQLEHQIMRLKITKDTRNLEYPEDKGSANKLFPHEFLFVMCNAIDRHKRINNIKHPVVTTEKMSIKKYEMQAMDARWLDNIFIIDINFFYKKHEKNPRNVLRQELNEEVKYVKIMFEGLGPMGKKYLQDLISGKGNKKDFKKRNDLSDEEMERVIKYK